MVLLNVAGVDVSCKKNGKNINCRISPLLMNNPIDVPLNSQKNES